MLLSFGGSAYSEFMHQYAYENGLSYRQAQHEAGPEYQKFKKHVLGQIKKKRKKKELTLTDIIKGRNKKRQRKSRLPSDIIKLSEALNIPLTGRKPGKKIVEGLFKRLATLEPKKIKHAPSMDLNKRFKNLRTDFDKSIPLEIQINSLTREIMGYRSQIELLNKIIESQKNQGYNYKFEQENLDKTRRKLNSNILEAQMALEVLNKMK